jgi:hypothetical protein
VGLFVYEYFALFFLILDAPYFIFCALIPLIPYILLYESLGVPPPYGISQETFRAYALIGSALFGLFFGVWFQFQLGQMKVFPDYLTNLFQKNKPQTNMKQMNNNQPKNLPQSIFGMILYCVSLFFYTVLWLIGMVISKLFTVFCIVLTVCACLLYESWGLPLSNHKDFSGYAVIGSVVFGIVLSICIKRSLIRFVAERFERWKLSLDNNVQNNYEKYEIKTSDFDFDLNQILDTPDVKDVKGWNAANEVLFLYYLQSKNELEKLTEPQRIFFLVNDFYSKILPSRLNCGGFQHFFMEECGNNAHETVIALQKVGAVKTADLLQECIEQFPTRHLPKDREERLNLINNFNNPDAEKIWNKCTKKYLAGLYKTENICTLCLEYVRQHKEHFRDI